MKGKKVTHYSMMHLIIEQCSARNMASKGMADETPLKSMDEIKWFHSIPLNDGTVTPGLDASMAKLEQICLPKDLSGKTVLDIGAWDGFFSFQAERHGAKRVLATDHFCWSGPGWGTKDGFNFVHNALDSKVESLDIDAMDISPDNVGKFDVVMFLGVLYHLQDPMAGLRVAASVCKDLLIIETVVDDLHRRKPSMVYYPGDSLNEDDTNYWAPNVAAMKGMLKDLGFTKVEVVYPVRPWIRYAFPVRFAASVKAMLTRRGPFSQTINQGRMSFHARR